MLTPAALVFLASDRYDSVPMLIGLRLVFGHHLEADRSIWLEVGLIVEFKE